jgi:hypothetical protein
MQSYMWQDAADDILLLRLDLADITTSGKFNGKKAPFDPTDPEIVCVVRRIKNFRHCAQIVSVTTSPSDSR